MRGTIHLVTADDCLLLRPLVQPVLDRELANHRDHAPRLVAVDLDAVKAAGREILAERPLNGAEFRPRSSSASPAATAPPWPMPAAIIWPWSRHRRAACGSGTPRSDLHCRGMARSARPRPSPSIDEVVLRYLAAFGPASNADIAAWCRLTGIREVTDRLRPRLRSFRDERGRELHDLPEAPRPDPDTPAPPRFLPEYDNAVLSHDDRSRFVPEAVRQLAERPQPAKGSLLVDGEVCAIWRIETDRTAGAATLIIVHVDCTRRRHDRRNRAGGGRPARSSSTPDTTHDVALVPFT